MAVVTKTAAEGREGARGSRRCWPRLRLFKGRTWLITVLLKTLIFISNPDGIASLAYLLAGLAVFCFLFFFLAGPVISLLFTQLRDSVPSSGGSELW